MYRRGDGGNGFATSTVKGSSSRQGGMEIGEMGSKSSPGDICVPMERDDKVVKSNSFLQSTKYLKNNVYCWLQSIDCYNLLYKANLNKKSYYKIVQINEPLYSFSYNNNILPS